MNKSEYRKFFQEFIDEQPKNEPLYLDPGFADKNARIAPSQSIRNINEDQLYHSFKMNSEKTAKPVKTPTKMV
jgi:hypothetical protein